MMSCSLLFSAVPKPSSFVPHCSSAQLAIGFQLIGENFVYYANVYFIISYFTITICVMVDIITEKNKAFIASEKFSSLLVSLFTL